jgi:hypothetical protein
MLEYMSTDAGAPVLDGNIGTMNTVLRAILVNGYGAKAAAGWAEPFAANANVAMFRPNGGLLRPYFQVNDAAPRAAPFANASECRIRPHETASGLLAVLTNPFPTGNGLIIRKSKDLSVSPWIAYADDRTLIMFIQSGDYGVGWSGFYIGEYFSLKATPDAFNGIAIGRVTEQVAATPTALPSQETLHSFSAVGAVTAGHSVPRSFTEVAQSQVSVGKHGAGEHSAADMVGLMEWPNPVDGSTNLDNIRVHELITPNFAKRGRLRGMWHLLHPAQAFNHLDTFNGSGAQAGKSFRIIKPTPNFLGVYVVEKSNTWETN